MAISTDASCPKEGQDRRLVPAWVCSTLASPSSSQNISACYGNFTAHPSGGELVLVGSGSIELFAVSKATGQLASISCQASVSTSLVAANTLETSKAGHGCAVDLLMLLSESGTLTVLLFSSALHKFIPVQQCLLWEPGTLGLDTGRLLAAAPGGQAAVVSPLHNMLALLPSLLSPGDAAALQAASQAGNGLPPSIHVFPHAPCHIDLISAVDGTAGETSSSGNNNGTGSPKCTIWSVAFLPGLAHSPEQGREAGGDAHMQDHGGTGAAATHMQAKALHLAVLMHRPGAPESELILLKCTTPSSSSSHRPASVHLSTACMVRVLLQQTGTIGIPSSLHLVPGSATGLVVLGTRSLLLLDFAQSLEQQPQDQGHVHHGHEEAPGVMLHAPGSGAGPEVEGTGCTSGATHMHVEGPCEALGGMRTSKACGVTCVRSLLRMGPDPEALARRIGTLLEAPSTGTTGPPGSSRFMDHREGALLKLLLREVEVVCEMEAVARRAGRGQGGAAGPGVAAAGGVPAAGEAGPSGAAGGPAQGAGGSSDTQGGAGAGPGSGADVEMSGGEGEGAAAQPQAAAAAGLGHLLHHAPPGPAAAGAAGAGASAAGAGAAAGGAHLPAGTSPLGAIMSAALNSGACELIFSGTMLHGPGDEHMALKGAWVSLHGRTTFVAASSTGNMVACPIEVQQPPSHAHYLAPHAPAHGHGASHAHAHGLGHQAHEPSAGAAGAGAGPSGVYNHHSSHAGATGGVHTATGHTGHANSSSSTVGMVMGSVVALGSPSMLQPPSCILGLSGTGGTFPGSVLLYCEEAGDVVLLGAGPSAAPLQPLMDNVSCGSLCAVGRLPGPGLVTGMAVADLLGEGIPQVYTGSARVMEGGHSLPHVPSAARGRGDNGEEASGLRGMQVCHAVNLVRTGPAVSTLSMWPPGTFPAVTGIWPVARSPGDAHHSLLVASFLGASRMLALSPPSSSASAGAYGEAGEGAAAGGAGSEGLGGGAAGAGPAAAGAGGAATPVELSLRDVTDMVALGACEPTVAIGAVLDGVCAQVTPTSVRLCCVEPAVDDRYWGHEGEEAEAALMYQQRQQRGLQGPGEPAPVGEQGRQPGMMQLLQGLGQAQDEGASLGAPAPAAGALGGGPGGSQGQGMALKAHVGGPASAGAGAWRAGAPRTKTSRLQEGPGRGRPLGWLPPSGPGGPRAHSWSGVPLPGGGSGSGAAQAGAGATCGGAGASGAAVGPEGVVAHSGGSFTGGSSRPGPGGASAAAPLLQDRPSGGGMGGGQLQPLASPGLPRPVARGGHAWLLSSGPVSAAGAAAAGGSGSGSGGTGGEASGPPAGAAAAAAGPAVASTSSPATSSGSPPPPSLTRHLQQRFGGLGQAGAAGGGGGPSTGWPSYQHQHLGFEAAASPLRVALDALEVASTATSEAHGATGAEGGGAPGEGGGPGAAAEALDGEVSGGDMEGVEEVEQPQPAQENRHGGAAHGAATAANAQQQAGPCGHQHQQPQPQGGLQAPGHRQPSSMDLPQHWVQQLAAEPLGVWDVAQLQQQARLSGCTGPAAGAGHGPGADASMSPSGGPNKPGPQVLTGCVVPGAVVLALSRESAVHVLAAVPAPLGWAGAAAGAGASRRKRSRMDSWSLRHAGCVPVGGEVTCVQAVPAPAWLAPSSPTGGQSYLLLVGHRAPGVSLVLVRMTPGGTATHTLLAQGPSLACPTLGPSSCCAAPEAPVPESVLLHVLGSLQGASAGTAGAGGGAGPGPGPCVQWMVAGRDGSLGLYQWRPPALPEGPQAQGPQSLLAVLSAAGAGRAGAGTPAAASAPELLWLGKLGASPLKLVSMGPPAGANTTAWAAGGAGGHGSAAAAGAAASTGAGWGYQSASAPGSSTAVGSTLPQRLSASVAAAAATSGGGTGASLGSGTGWPGVLAIGSSAFSVHVSQPHSQVTWRVLGLEQVVHAACLALPPQVSTSGGTGMPGAGGAAPAGGQSQAVSQPLSQQQQQLLVAVHMDTSWRIAQLSGPAQAAASSGLAPPGAASASAAACAPSPRPSLTRLLQQDNEADSYYNYLPPVRQLLAHRTSGSLIAACSSGSSHAQHGPTLDVPSVLQAIQPSTGEVTAKLELLLSCQITCAALWRAELHCRPLPHLLPPPPAASVPAAAASAALEAAAGASTSLASVIAASGRAVPGGLRSHALGSHSHQRSMHAVAVAGQAPAASPASHAHPHHHQRHHSHHRHGPAGTSRDAGGASGSGAEGAAAAAAGGSVPGAQQGGAGPSGAGPRPHHHHRRPHEGARSSRRGGAHGMMGLFEPRLAITELLVVGMAVDEPAPAGPSTSASSEPECKGIVRVYFVGQGAFQAVAQARLPAPVGAVCGLRPRVVVAGVGRRLVALTRKGSKLSSAGWISTRHPTTHLACCEGRDLLAAADGSFTVTLYAYMPQLTRAGREEEGRLQPFQVIAADAVPRAVTALALLPCDDVPGGPSSQQPQPQPSMGMGPSGQPSTSAVPEAPPPPPVPGAGSGGAGGQGAAAGTAGQASRLATLGCDVLVAVADAGGSVALLQAPPANPTQPMRNLDPVATFYVGDVVTGMAVTDSLSDRVAGPEHRQEDWDVASQEQQQFGGQGWVPGGMTDATLSPGQSTPSSGGAAPGLAPASPDIAMGFASPRGIPSHPHLLSAGSLLAAASSPGAGSGKRAPRLQLLCAGVSGALYSLLPAPGPASAALLGEVEAALAGALWAGGLCGGSHAAHRGQLKLGAVQLHYPPSKRGVVDGDLLACFLSAPRALQARVLEQLLRNGSCSGRLQQLVQGALGSAAAEAASAGLLGGPEEWSDSHMTPKDDPMAGLEAAPETGQPQQQPPEAMLLASLVQLVESCMGQV